MASSSGQLDESQMTDRLGNPIISSDITKAKSVSDTDIEKLARDVSNSDMMAVINLVEKVTEKQMGPVEFSIFDYVGFDPLMIARVFKAYQSHYKDKEETTLSDIKFSIAACLYMGNIQTKAMTRRIAEGRTKLEYLTRKYNVRLGSTGTGIPAAALTFPRIAAAFPVMAIKMAVSVKVKSVLHDFNTNNSPHYLRVMPFASICSSNMDQDLRTMLLEAVNAFSTDMSIAYEVGRCKKAKKEIKYDPIAMAQEQWAFIEVASNSPVPTEESRKALLTQLNISKDYAEISKIVRKYRSIMGKKTEKEVEVLDEKEFSNRLTAYISSETSSL